MPGQIKRTIKRGLKAAGYELIRSPVSDLRFAVSGPLVGLNASTATDSSKAPRFADRKPASDYFTEVEMLLDRIIPWSGEVPEGYVVDFLGVLRDARFIWNATGPSKAHHESTSLPTVGADGEGYFEVASWLLSAHEARERYVVVSLGASFGYQLVGAWKALQVINPMPSLLVGVEPVPQNCDWIRRHMGDNGIDPAEHWIVQAALGHDNEPTFFPVGAPGTGLNSSQVSNAAESRRHYLNLVRVGGHSERVLENILLYNSTGITRDLGRGYTGEVKLVSTVTLRDVLSPLTRVDLLEVDIQQAEIDVIPPYMDLVSKKVRRVHIGTHGREAHDLMHSLFAGAGWEIIIEYAPDSRHVTERGTMDLGDGIFIARNPTI